MGNQLVGIAPSQIYPVERYLTEHPELKFDTSLGSTRFLKVARAESQEGLVVVKVFVIHDPSLPLMSVKDHLEEVRKKLSTAVNCIPFQKIILTDKAGLIIREYVKYSLYDRLSTRPFLTNIEKRWITFQILYALHQCHKVGVCHGDIKLENIMVTSWNWVLLVDFASFKPTFLPVDNTGDYSYFFDTSRRRVCLMAPERFSNIRMIKTESSSMISEACDSKDLTPAMDIFSAGCALLELWNELHVPFDYSQLLSYCVDKYYPEKHLDNLEDPILRSLIENMIEKEPSQRKSAESYLAEYRGTLFPEYFYSFLQSYMLIFSSTPILTPDEKIVRLKGDIHNIFTFLGPLTQSSSENSNEKQDFDKIDKGECEGLVIITSLVTSCIRGLHDCSSKLYSLEILLELSSHASDETILDRILPYIIFLAHDSSTRVKICAIDTITKCLDMVTRIPRSDANVFPEYILPELAPLATDPSTCVRAAYAKNIANLAEISIRYLDGIQTDWYGNHYKDTDEHIFSYDLELQALHEMISQTVLALLTDTQPIVKQTLIESGIAKLCVFFGKAKANDIILSHMITFLNDKEDRELRGAFFSSIVGVAAYIGWHCASILAPLLLQGLTDSSEFVIAKSINAMSALTDLGLLKKPSLCELVSESVPFLVHPSLWIRQALAGFLSSAAKSLSVLDVQCKIMPHLKAYLVKHSLIQIEIPELLLESLVDPISRTVYDNVVLHNDVDALLEILRERKLVRECVNTGKVPSSNYYNRETQMKNLLTRLQAIGMDEVMENYLLRMGHHLKKINKHKLNSEARHTKQSEGRIEISTFNSTVKSHVFNLGEAPKGDFMANRILHRTNTSGSIDTNVNSDWNYSSEVLTRQSESTNSGGPSSRSTSSRPSSPPPEGHNQFLSTEPSTNVSLHERSYIQYHRSSCYVELSNLKNRQQEQYLEALRNKDWEEHTAWRPQLPPPGWRLRGILAAHLHEHRSAVNKLCVLPDSPLFASASSDGTIRLWDCSKIEGKNIANRAKQVYRVQGHNNAITGMTVCEAGQSLAYTSQDGSVNVIRLDTASNKMNLALSRHLNSDEDGFPLETHCMDSGSKSIVVYTTLFGSVVGWDLRAPGNAFKLENGVDRIITTFCVDPNHNWLTLGTANGTLDTWDLRFQLPINSIPYSTTRIQKVVTHPTEPSWVISSVRGTNEITMWNIETCLRQKVLWGATTPPLSEREVNKYAYSVCAMLGGCIDRSPFLLAGGSDQRLRFWDLENPSESYLAIPAARDPPGTALNYDGRLIDGLFVTYEEAVPVKKVIDGVEEIPRAGPEPPPAGHRDCISDVILCKATQCFLVTSSRDGVIKVWK